jgi:hypothetical protein
MHIRSMITKEQLVNGSIVGYFAMPSRALAEANPEAYSNALRGLPAGAGSCQYCGTGIHHHIVVRLADLRTVFIGTDCAEKVGFDAREVRFAMSKQEREEIAARAAARAAATDWDVIQFGKHKGARVSDLITSDRSYVEWLASTGGGEQSNAGVARRLIAEARAPRIAAAAAAIALLDGLTATVTHVRSDWGFHRLETPIVKPAYWAGRAAGALKNGRTLRIEEVDGAIGEVLKSEGHSSRGKKNQAAREARSAELFAMLRLFAAE